MSQSPPRKRRWPYVVGGLAVLLVAVVAVGLWRLDALLLQRARDEAAHYAQQLGRPVEIGAVSTRLLPSVGVEVSKVSVGAAEGEQVPLVELQRLSVAVALWPALTSRGKDLQVKDAELSGLTVNVVRLVDGTTNVSRVQEKLAQQPAAPAEPTPPPAEEAPAQDLSGVHVDRAALTDATLRFIDRQGAQARELAITHLDVEVKDLHAGKPLRVVLNAAVLTAQQNFHVTLDTAPLPPTLVPVPERVVIKSEPIDLSPLGPFLGPDVGLQAGTLQADWTAQLGSAVPGGSGPTNLQGGLHAQGLRFTGSEGGKALDVVLDTDVTGDLKAGDLTLNKLLVQLGPARLTGKGQVKGMLTPSPVVKDFELLGQNLDPALLAEYYPPLRKSLGTQVAGPVGFVVRGEGTQQAQALTAETDLTPVRLRLPEQLNKEAGAPMKLTARLSGAAASGGALRFDVKAELAGVDLRPGGQLDKRPGQPFSLDLAGTYQPSSTKTPMKAELSRMNVVLRESTLSGTASVAIAGQGAKKTTTFALAVKSPRLDLDSLRLKSEASTAPASDKPTSKAEAPADPQRFHGLRGDIRLEVGWLKMNEMELSNVVAQLKMVDDLITVEHFSTGVFGGTLAASGSSVRLGPVTAQRPFELKAEAKGIDMAQALANRVPRKVLGGKFDGQLDFKGVGYEAQDLQERLAGAMQGSLQGGVFFGADLPATVAGPLVKALPFAGKVVNSEGETKLADQLPFGLKIENGVARLSKPLTWTRPEAAMSFEGGIRLDGTLDLTGTVNLTPPLVQKLTLGKVTPNEPLPVPLKLGGKAWSPEVKEVNVTPAVTTLAKLAAVSVATGLLGDKGKEVGKLLNTPPSNLGQAAGPQVQQTTQQQADALRKKAEQEGKKQLQNLFKH